MQWMQLAKAQLARCANRIQIEIDLHDDPDHENPQIFSLDDEDGEKGIAYLPVLVTL
jgi:hypothetical protein